MVSRVVYWLCCEGRQRRILIDWLFWTYCVGRRRRILFYWLFLAYSVGRQRRILIYWLFWAYSVGRHMRVMTCGLFWANFSDREEKVVIYYWWSWLYRGGRYMRVVLYLVVINLFCRVGEEEDGLAELTWRGRRWTTSGAAAEGCGWRKRRSRWSRERWSPRLGSGPPRWPWRWCTGPCRHTPTQHSENPHLVLDIQYVRVWIEDKNDIFSLFPICNSSGLLFLYPFYC